jgi:parvulin-like peptidyl-prolyl isomerase
MMNHKMLLKRMTVYVFVVCVAMVGAIFCECCTAKMPQSGSRQSTPDPYFQPAQVPVEVRYQDAAPYTPPTFAPQPSSMPVANTFSNQPPISEIPKVAWAPPITAVKVANSQTPNEIPSSKFELSVPGQVPEAASSFDNIWNPPPTPIDVRPAGLANKDASKEFPPMTIPVAIPEVAPSSTPAIASPPKSIIREQAVPKSEFMPKKPASQSGQQLVVTNSFIENGQALDSELAPKKIPTSTVKNDFQPLGAVANAKPKRSFESFEVVPQKIKTPAQPVSMPQAQANEFNEVPKNSSVRTASMNKELPKASFGSIRNNFGPEIDSESFEPGRVLALVGGEPIFVGDMMFQVNQAIEHRMPGAPESTRKEIRPKLIKMLLPQFVNNKMLYVSALESMPDGVEINSVIEQAADQFDEKELPRMVESSGVKNIAEFEANLRAQGSSIKQLRTAWAKEQIGKWTLGQKLNVVSSVSHQELLDEYHGSLASYEVKAKAKWEQILIRFDRTSSRDEARATAKEVLEQVVYGGNFAAVAKKVSHGFRAEQGGQHDWTSKGSLVLKEIDAALFSMPLGKVSDLIETRDGLHIVRIIDRTQEGHVPFLEAQVEIKEQLLEKKRVQAIEKYIDTLKESIPVEYFTSN